APRIDPPVDHMADGVIPAASGHRRAAGQHEGTRSMNSRFEQTEAERHALVERLQSLLQGKRLRARRANWLSDVDEAIEIFFDPCRGKEEPAIDHLMTIVIPSFRAPGLKGLQCTLRNCEGHPPFER